MDSNRIIFQLIKFSVLECGKCFSHFIYGSFEIFKCKFMTSVPLIFFLCHILHKLCFFTG